MFMTGLEYNLSEKLITNCTMVVGENAVVVRVLYSTVLAVFC